MSCENDLCSLLEEAIQMLEEARKDASKCQHKCNKSAGVRVRKTCQNVRAKLGEVRAAVQELKDRPRSACKEG